MKLWLYLIQPFLYIWFTAMLIFIALPVVLVALPFRQETRIKITSKMWIRFYRLMLKTVFFTNLLTIDRRDEESQKKVSPPGLYIANHQSFGDIAVLFSKIIMPPIMKKQVLYVPLLGLLAYASGSIVVDRTKRDSRRKVFELCKKELTTNRRQLQYYPEGTRRREEGKGPRPVEEIKTVLIELAFEYNIPVYPVSIYGTPEVVNGGLIVPGKRTGIILHGALHAYEFADKTAFTKAAWDKVIQGYFELERKVHS